MDFAHPEDIEGILTDFNNLLVNILPTNWVLKKSKGIISG
jgi:hypothetical protein